jgi:hypothetical protein
MKGKEMSKEKKEKLDRWVSEHGRPPLLMFGYREDDEGAYLDVYDSEYPTVKTTVNLGELLMEYWLDKPFLDRLIAAHIPAKH